MADQQDWEPVVFKKNIQPTTKDGKPIPKIKLTDEQIRLNKVDNEEIQIKKVSLELRIIIQRARQNLKMSQAQLAQQINQKQNVINEYENGKAVPNNQILSKLERVLKTKLRGKNLGQPL